MQIRFHVEIMFPFYLFLFRHGGVIELLSGHLLSQIWVSIRPVGLLWPKTWPVSWKIHGADIRL
mgnify:CR=1 FL=1|jgi:hypothetical protein